MSNKVTFNEIAKAVEDILEKITKNNYEQSYINDIVNEGITFFKKSNNFELLFKCYTIQIDFLLNKNDINKAQEIMNEIYNSKEYKEDKVFNSECEIDASQTLKILFLLQELEIYLRKNNIKQLLLRTIIVKKRIGEIFDARVKSRIN